MSIPSLAFELLSGIVTSAVGLLLSTTTKKVVCPDSWVTSPVIGVMSMAGVPAAGKAGSSEVPQALSSEHNSTYEIALSGEVALVASEEWNGECDVRGEMFHREVKVSTQPDII